MENLTTEQKQAIETLLNARSVSKAEFNRLMVDELAEIERLKQERQDKLSEILEDLRYVDYRDVNSVDNSNLKNLFIELSDIDVEIGKTQKIITRAEQVLKGLRIALK